MPNRKDNKRTEPKKEKIKDRAYDAKRYAIRKEKRKNRTNEEKTKDSTK